MCDCLLYDTSPHFYLQEVTDEIKNATANGFSVTCPFAIDEKATIMDVRKKNNKSLVTNSKAHKIPVQLLEPFFVAYVRHCKSQHLALSLVYSSQYTSLSSSSRQIN